MVPDAWARGRRLREEEDAAWALSGSLRGSLLIPRVLTRVPAESWSPPPPSSEGLGSPGAHPPSSEGSGSPGDPRPPALRARGVPEPTPRPQL